MKTVPGLVYLLDDEPSLLVALTRLLQTEGHVVHGFTTPAAFLAAYQRDEPACLVLDVAMPEIDGLEFQQILRQAGLLVPIIFLTGHGSIPMSVRAIKAGAVDFLTKPVEATDLLRSVDQALQRATAQGRILREATELTRRLAQLTPRECEVLRHIITGKLNKQIAADLGTGEQTIKVHRGRVMEKMGATSVADLVRIAQKVGLGPADVAASV
jgi:FixJ family two-component response regulator